MSNFNYAQSFPAIIVGEAFNASIDHAANNGQIAHCLQTAALQCGIVIAAKPVTFIHELNNNYLQQGTKAPDAKSIKVIQALHALAIALKSSGKVSNLPEINGLPSWADPAAIAAKKTAAKEKAAAKKAAIAVAETIEPVIMAAPVVAVVSVADFEALIIAIRSGDFTAKELSQLQNAVDFATAKSKAPATVAA